MFIQLFSFNLKAMKLFLTILSVTITCLCHAQVFSKEESDFIDKVSALLNRATVTIKKGIVESSAEGNYYKFEIDIEDFKYDSVKAKTNLLKASSIPAYLFLKDNIARNVNYRYVDVVVKVENDEIISRFSIQQLLLVDSCLATVNGYLYGIKELNEDSLIYYSSKELLTKIPPDILIDQLKLVIPKVGNVTDLLLNGFRIDTIKDKELVYFSAYLRRKSGDNLIEIWLDERNKKVTLIDL